MKDHIEVGDQKIFGPSFFSRAKYFGAISIPSILSNLIVPITSLVDLSILGQSKAVLPVAAISLASLIFDYLFLGFNFFRMGTTAQTVKVFKGEVSFDVKMSLITSLKASLLLGLGLILLSKPILMVSKFLLGANQEMGHLIEVYFYARIMGAPAVFSIMSCNGWYLAIQKPKIGLYITFFVNLINIALSIILVKLGFGILGVGLATSVANWATLLGFLLLNRYVSFTDLLTTFPANKLKDFFQFNLNILVRTFCLITIFSLLTHFSNDLGAVVLVSNTLILRLLGVYSYFIDGFAYTLESLGGFYFHQNKKRELIRVLVISVLYSIICYGIFFIALNSFWDEVITFLNKNPKVLTASISIKIFLFVSMLLGAGAYLLDGLFVGFADGKNLRNNVIFAFCISLLGFCYFKFYNQSNIVLWQSFCLFLALRTFYLSIVLLKKLK